MSIITDDNGSSKTTSEQSAGETGQAARVRATADAALSDAAAQTIGRLPKRAP